MGLSRRQFILGAAGTGLLLLSNPLPKIFPVWGSSLAFGAGIKYVSNRKTAGGNGTLGNPYRVDEVWANLEPGDEFVYLNGIYQGAASMLNVANGGGQGKSGTAPAWVTLRAETDGGVTFDGQFVNKPMRFAANNYMIVTGFNVCNSVQAVVELASPACSWMQFKRICAWDANANDNCHVFSMSYGSNILVEDCACWGIGRKKFEAYSGGSGTSGGYGFGGMTLRRHWASWGSFGGGAFGPRHTYCLTYDYTNVLAENIIGTWDTEPGAVITNIYDIIGNDGHALKSAYLQVYGSLAYLRQNQSCPVSQMTSFTDSAYSATLKDVYSCIEPGPNHTDKRPFLNGNTTTYPSTLNGLYTIKNGTASQIAPTGWTYSNLNEGGPRSLPMIPQYVDGVKTGNPLLPWPMNQRIIDARIQSGRSAVDVTATVQQVLGSGAGNNPPPGAPGGLRVS